MTLLGPAPTREVPAFSAPIVKGSTPGHTVRVLHRSEVRRLAYDLTALQALDRLAEHRKAIA